MKIDELDEGMTYVCTRCKYVHHIIPSHGTCRAGRSMRTEGCTCSEFDQGVFWFRHGSSEWDRGCYHFVLVGKGEDCEEAKSAYAMRLLENQLELFR